MAAGMVQILLKAWVLSTVPGTGSNRKLPSGHLSWTWGHFFHFSFFLLRLVVGVPHHEKQKHKRTVVGDIDSYQEIVAPESLRSFDL